MCAGSGGEKRGGSGGSGVPTGRPVCHTSPERTRRQGQRPPASGYEATWDSDGDAALPRVGRCERPKAGPERSWQDAFTSFCQDMQRWGSISGESARPQATVVGGAAVESARPGITYSSSVGGGNRRLADYGRGLERTVGGEGGASIRRLFGDERAVPEILEFLEGTRVGKMPGRILVAGGPGLEEEELEGFSLQVQGEGEEGTGLSSSEEKEKPAPPPLECILPLLSFLC